MTALLAVLWLAGSWWQPDPAQASVQAAGVTGLVTNARTSAPIADVRVVVVADDDGLEREARTGRDGRFVLVGLPPGPSTLTVSTIGYIFVRRRVEIPASGALDLAVPLAEGTGTYEEAVTVTPASTAAPAGDIRELSSGQLQDLRGVAADDPVRAVQALPGVATGDDFQAEFSVRGSAYRHVGLVLDGVATPLLFHTVHGTEDTGSVAMINTDIVSRASLRTGPHAQTHGNWLGATLDFGLRQGSRDRVSVRGAVSGTAASGIAEGPLTPSHRGSWLISVRKSYIDWLVRKLDPEIESTISFVDTQGKVVLDLTPRQQVQFLVLGGNASYDKPTANSANDIATATSTSVLASAEWRLARDRFLISDRVSIVTNRFRNRGLFFQEQARGDTDAIVWRTDLTMPIRSWTMDAGASLEGQHAASVFRNFQAVTPTTARLRAMRESDRRRTMQAGWVSLGGRIAAVGVTTGLRISHDTVSDQFDTSPWILAERTFGDITLVASASRALQYSSLEDAAAAVGPLSPEHAFLVDVGARRSLGAGTRLSVTGFRRNESDLLRRVSENKLVNDVRVNESIFPTVASRLSGTANGVDVVFDRQSERGPTGWFAYTWAHTKHDDGITGESFDGDYDQRHTLNAVLQQRLSYRLRVSAKFRYGSNFPIVGYFEGSPQDLRLSGARNQVRLPAYARLDLHGSRTFTFSRSRLTLFVEVMNVLNRDNFGPSDGVVLPNLMALEFTEELIPLLPSAGVLIEF